MCVGLSAKVVRISDGTAVVDAGMYYRENVNHPTVKYLERSVHRSIR